MKFDSQITFFYSDKYEETIDFYTNILGLHPVLDQGKCMIFSVTENSYLGFCTRVKPAPTDGVIFTFVTEDVDKWYEELQAKGVNFSKAPEINKEYNIYHTFMYDPNGYKLEIQKFLDNNWNK